MVMQYGVPNTMNFVPTGVLDALYKYWALPQQLAAQKAVAGTEAGSRAAAARIAAQGGVDVAQIGRLGQLQQLIPELALRQAQLQGGGSLRDTLGMAYYLAGQGGQPGNVPLNASNIANMLSGIFGPGVFSGPGSSGGGGWGGGGRDSDSEERSGNRPRTQPVDQGFAYSAANGMNAPRNPGGGYRVLTGDRWLQKTGVPTGDEEVVDVDDNNRLVKIQPVFQRPETTREPYTRPPAAWQGGYRSYSGPFPNTGAGIPPGGIPYGDDSQVKGFTPPAASPAGLINLALGQPGATTTFDYIKMLLGGAGGAPSKMTFSAAEGFTPPKFDINNPLGFLSGLTGQDTGGLSGILGQTQQSLQKFRSGTPAVGAPRPSPTTPSATDTNQDLFSRLNNIPTLQLLRNQINRVPAFGALGGSAQTAIPEVGVGPFNLPHTGARAFQQAGPFERQNMIDLWAAAGIPPEVALYMIANATPGARLNPVTAFSYS